MKVELAPNVQKLKMLRSDLKGIEDTLNSRKGTNIMFKNGGDKYGTYC